MPVTRLIIRDAEGRDISDDVILEKHCWKCHRIFYQGRQIGELLFGCPDDGTFVDGYSYEEREEHILRTDLRDPRKDLWYQRGR